MAFWGHSFTFNGIPCEDFDLMLYNIGEHAHSSGKFASGVSIIEEKLASRWKPIFYGTQINKKLEFSIVFGVNPSRTDCHKPLDRHELETIANWLTGHNQYLWLEIEQEDLEYIRYHCIITELEMIEYGSMPWALRASVTCDGPYAYLYPQTFEYEVDSDTTINFYNESGHNGYLYPKIEIDITRGTDYTITNQSDNNRVFAFTDAPVSTRLFIDNDTGIITSSTDENMYSCFNFKFFRLVRGENILKINGNGTLRITCEFPVNVGG